MVGKSLKKLFGGGTTETEEDQFRVIVDDLTDSRDKVFVWQFPGLTQPELEELYEDVLQDVVTRGMLAEHVFTTAEIELDELILDGQNPIQIRDNVYSLLAEEE